MDFAYICTKEGYRRQDLTPEHQEALKLCDDMVEKLDNLRNNIEFIDEEATDDTVIGKMKKEIIEKTIDKAVEWLEAHVCEIQVSLAEKEPSKD